MGTILRAGGRSEGEARANLGRLFEVLSTGERVTWLPGLSQDELNTVRSLGGQVVGSTLTGVTMTDLVLTGAYPQDLSAIRSTDLWLTMGRLDA